MVRCGTYVVFKIEPIFKMSLHVIFYLVVFCWVIKKLTIYFTWTLKKSITYLSALKISDKIFFFQKIVIFDKFPGKCL